MAEEFGEEEVWSYGMEMMREGSSCSNFNKGSNFPSLNSCGGLSSAPRPIPNTNTNTNTTSIHNFDEGPEKVNGRQSSAPLNIPDWSTIYGENGNSSRNGYRHHHHHHVHDHSHVHGDEDEGDEEEEEDGNDDGMVPPHEWLSKKLARTQISSFSMCEGIGRTLKGRDLSRVRNAVLTKTGFLE